jgi:hypothetical protein
VSCVEASELPTIVESEGGGDGDNGDEPSSSQGNSSGPSPQGDGGGRLEGDGDNRDEPSSLQGNSSGRRHRSHQGGGGRESTRRRTTLAKQEGLYAAGHRNDDPYCDVANELDLLDCLDEEERRMTILRLLCEHVVPRMTIAPPTNQTMNDEDEDAEQAGCHVLSETNLSQHNNNNNKALMG